MMINCLLSSLLTTLFSLSFKPSFMGFLRPATRSQNWYSQCFRLFLKQFITLRNQFLFQLHDKLPENLVAYTNHFMLVMILWVSNLGRTPRGHCFFPHGTSWTWRIHSHDGFFFFLPFFFFF